MNKVYKINGFVYVTSFKDKTESEEWYEFFKREVILTNDPNLNEVQHLTPREVDYLNTIDECEVKTENICARCYSNDVDDCWSAKECSDGKFDKIKYKLQLPKQETIEEVANKYSGYHKSYIDKTDVKGSAFLDGYNHALNTLYTAQQVTEYAYYFEKCYAERPMKKPLLPTDYFNQNKKKCKHQNINRVDGLDECLDCGTKNH